ncbi:MAG: glycerophosphodiester phosphodiesterase family protein, partial [Rhodococcus sp. (in: high G+C Gram-positive bacteria)]
MSTSRRDPFVVAHRGASAEKKEHTLAAYDLALREGADGLECDVRLTRDGHIVCVHDRRVDRTSTGSGRVSELHLEALKAFDYGDDAEPAELLTLSDLIELVLDWTSKPTKLFIETKHPVRYGSLIEN